MKPMIIIKTFVQRITLSRLAKHSSLDLDALFSELQARIDAGNKIEVGSGLLDNQTLDTLNELCFITRLAWDRIESSMLFDPQSRFELASKFSPLFQKGADILGKAKGNKDLDDATRLKLKGMHSNVSLRLEKLETFMDRDKTLNCTFEKIRAVDDRMVQWHKKNRPEKMLSASSR